MFRIVAFLVLTAHVLVAGAVLSHEDSSTGLAVAAQTVTLGAAICLVMFAIDRIRAVTERGVLVLERLAAPRAYTAEPGTTHPEAPAYRVVAGEAPPLFGVVGTIDLQDVRRVVIAEDEEAARAHADAEGIKVTSVERIAAFDPAR